MKTLFYCSIIMLIVVGCSKYTTNNTPFTGNWTLIKSVQIWFTGAQFATYPAKDSAVSLILSTDYTYQSKLNNVVVSKGNYTVSTPSVQPLLTSSFQRDLKLQNFQLTGIFQENTGQITPPDTANFLMNVSQDTMTLTPALIAPGIQMVYYFIK